MESLEWTARQVGGLAWIAGELSAIEGRWAPTFVDPAAVEHLATHSRHHRWHATMWTEALPDSPALDAIKNICAPSTGWDAAARLSQDEVVASDVHGLALLYRGLLPRLVTRLRSFGTALRGPGTGAIQRIVGLVSVDVGGDVQGGLGVMATALSDHESDEIAARSTKTLDRAFRT